MKEADRQIIQRLNEIHDAQAAGGAASFATLTGDPSDNAALDAALDAKQGDLGYTPVPETRTVNGHELSGNVTVTKGDVGLGNADNTSDAAKPVSTDQATAIAGKVSDTAYDATSWDGVTTIAPSKNAVRDKIEAVVASIPTAPYLVYTALLTQSGTDAPVATVLQNTLGGTVVWTYSTIGEYLGTLIAAFTESKTFINLGNPVQATSSSPKLSVAKRLDTNVVIVNSGEIVISIGPEYAALDSILVATSIEIRVYP